MTARRRLVRVPASSANLGPGYDVLAVALTLHLELEVEETGSFSVDSDGLDVPLARSNLLVRAFERLKRTLHITEVLLLARMGGHQALYGFGTEDGVADNFVALDIEFGRRDYGVLRKCHARGNDQGDGN